MSIPKVAIVADYSQDPILREAFRRADSAADYPANSFIRLLEAQMANDPIGGEDFHTVMETRPTAGVYSSLHYMLFKGEGDQAYHFHPPANGNMDSSMRHVLLYALDTVDPDSGIGNHKTTFEWFDIADPVVSHRAYARDDIPVTTGKSLSPRYKLELDPGQVALLSFGAGIHRFGGNGGAVAISLHPLDVDTGSAHGSFLGNTAAYEGNVPEAVAPLKASGPGRNLVPGTIITLQDLFTAHARVCKRDLEADPGRKMTSKRLKDLVENLRQASGYAPVGLIPRAEEQVIGLRV